jgi:hypothetical protein
MGNRAWTILEASALAVRAVAPGWLSGGLCGRLCGLLGRLAGLLGGLSGGGRRV